MCRLLLEWQIRHMMRAQNRIVSPREFAVVQEDLIWQQS